MFNVLFFLQMFVQLVEKSERVFNASSTLTPDSMMSDESQSRDWVVLPTAGASNTADLPQKALDSDIRQFSSVSAESIESCVPDNSANTCECSDVAESPQMHNRCMLSGIDVSSLNSDASISFDSADVSAVAELNDAQLSIADGNSSLNSTLKGSDEEKSSSEHNDAEIDTLQPTFSVSIPISTMFETATNDNKNADVPTTDVKILSGRGSRAVMTEYSPISDAGEETPVCQSPLHQPSTPSVNKRSAEIAFSPISPFTPRPSNPSTPLTVVPLSWSSDVSSSSATCDTSVWNTSTTVAETADLGKTGQHHLDEVMSSAPAVSPNRYFTFTQSSSYSHRSALGHGNNLIRPVQVTAPAGYCQNASFEQHQQQHNSVYLHQIYQHAENGNPSMISPERHCLSRSPQTCMCFTSCNTVAGSISTHPSYSAGSQKQAATQLSSVESEKYTAGLSTIVGPGGPGSKTNSHSFIMSPHQEARLVQEAKDVTSHAIVSNCGNLDTSQIHYNATVSADFSKSNHG